MLALTLALVVVAGQAYAAGVRSPAELHAPVEARANRSIHSSLTVKGHTGGAVSAVVAQGATAWVREGIGISELDLGDDRAIRMVRHFVPDFDADVLSLARAGNYLFAGTSRELMVLDWPAQGVPQIVSRTPLGGSVVALAAQRSSTAGAMTGSGGVVAAGVAGRGTFWVAFDDAGALGERWLVPDGTQPTLIASAFDSTGRLALIPGEVKAPGSNDVLSRDVLYLVARSSRGVPERLSSLPFPEPVLGVAWGSGSQAFVCTQAGLSVVDFENPAAPVPLASLGGVRCGSLIYGNRTLYLIRDGIERVDVADPVHPKRIGQAVADGLPGTVSLATWSHGLVAARNTSATVVGLDGDMQRGIAMDYRPAWPVADAVLSSDRLYVARGAEGLQMLDIAQLDAPQVQLSARLDGVFGAAIQGAWVYLSTGRGLARLDTRSGTMMPEFAPEWPPTRAIAVDALRLVAGNGQRLLVADLTPRGGPRMIGSFDLAHDPDWPKGADVEAVAVYEDYLAYVAAGPGGLAVLDLTDPDRATVVAQVPLPEGAVAQSIALSYPTLAVGTSHGVAVFYVGGGASFTPELRAWVPGIDALDLALNGRWLYVAAGQEGVRIMDVQVPAEPRTVLAATWPFPITRVVADANRVILAGSGLLLFELNAALLDTGGVIPTALPPVATADPVPIIPTANPAPGASSTPPPAQPAEPTPTPPVTPPARPGPLSGILYLPLIRR